MAGLPLGSAGARAREDIPTHRPTDEGKRQGFDVLRVLRFSFLFSLYGANAESFDFFLGGVVSVFCFSLSF